VEFNSSKDSYRRTIEEQIAFAGKGHDFYTRVKADHAIGVIARQLPGTQHPDVLDIGCGHGYIHPMLAAAGYRVTGVETADEVLELAREDNPDNTYITYIAHDGQHLPFPDETFDVVMAVGVMHHVPPDEWPNFLTEARRVLRPGGLVLIYEHNPLNPMTRYVVANTYIDDDAVLLRHTQLKTLLRCTGFSEVRSRFVLFTPFAASVFRRLDAALGWLPLGAQYGAIGTRA